MSGRFIGDNIRATQDAANICRLERQDGLIVAVDFSKAFDTVRWEFLFRALEWYGFGPAFVNLIKMVL